MDLKKNVCRSVLVFSILAGVNSPPELVVAADRAVLSPRLDSSKLVVRIEPERQEVTQGDPAVFKSKTVAAPDRRLNEYWRGPGDQSGKGRSFSVNTRLLSPGEYPVVLEVGDSPEARPQATATLVVKPRKTRTTPLPEGRPEVSSPAEPPVKRKLPRDVGPPPTSDATLDSGGRRRQPVKPPPSESPKASKLVATIYPDHRDVTQGESAVFESKTRSAPNSRLNESWTGPGRQRALGRSFSVNTDELRPGKYRVKLDVSNNLEESAYAFAILEVIPKKVRTPPPSEPPPVVGRLPEPPRRPKPTISRLSARIDPEYQEVIQGEPAFFESNTVSDSNSRITEFWIGPGKQRERGRSFSVNTGELEPTKYRVILDVRDDREGKDQAVATFVVRPKPNPPREGLPLVPPGSPSNLGEPLDSPVQNEVAPQSSPKAPTRPVEPPAPTVEKKVARPSPKKSPVLPPVARIVPRLLEVGGGEIAIFDGSQSRGSIQETSWKLDPSGAQGNNRSFEINTAQLKPGSYNVILDVVDNQGLRATDTAVLILRTPKGIDWALILEFMAAGIVGGAIGWWFTKGGTFPPGTDIRVVSSSGAGRQEVQSEMDIFSAPVLRIRSRSETSLMAVDSDAVIVKEVRRIHE